MSRTVATPAQLPDREYEAWKGFRRALRREDRERFDAPFGMARGWPAAIGESGAPVAFEAVVLAVPVEPLRRVKELERRPGEER